MLDGGLCFDGLNVEDGGWAGFAIGFGSGGLVLALHPVFHHYAFHQEGDGAFVFGGLA